MEGQKKKTSYKVLIIGGFIHWYSTGKKIWVTLHFFK